MSDAGSPGNAIVVVSGSPDETRLTGFRLAEVMKRKKSATILLYGDLGAGKTTFVQGIASAIGIPERNVGSASFVIIAEFESEPPLHHVDLYRISGPGEAEELGISEYIGSPGFTVIEWAERLGEAPDHSCRVTIGFSGDDGRVISIEGTGLLTSEEVSSLTRSFP